MSPILFNCAANLACDVIDGITDRLTQPAKTPAPDSTAPASFSDVLSGVQQTPAARAALEAAKKQAQLTSGILSSPEMAAALVQADPRQPVQVEFGAHGQVSLRSGNGELRPLALPADTRAQAEQLYALRNPGAALMGPSAARPAVLVVDPARTVAPTWSELAARR